MKKLKNGKNAKIENNVGCSILIKFLVKICFWRRNLSFQILLQYQIINISLLTVWRRRGLKIQNYGILFCDFYVPGGFFELTNKFSTISAPQNIFSSSIPVFIASQTTSFQFSHFRYFCNFLHFSWFSFNFLFFSCFDR